MTVNHGMAAGTEGGTGSWPMKPNPGDLSRRLASRRAELRLSLIQVASRAGIELRYLSYLENFPGHADAATLRRLAAALQTTPAALLGAGQETPPGGDPDEACWGSAGLVEPLAAAECYRLLGLRGIGRIAFRTVSGLVVVPVNYVVQDATVVIKTGTGSLISIHCDGLVSFEVDHFDLALAQGWSVLIQGSAHRVLQPGELRHLRESCDLRPWPAGEHDLFVRIVPGHIAGRRIRSQ
jgi:transcriptional regulator with XRE-family HTH domain